MVAALGDFRQLKYRSELASLYESYLVARWLEANDKYPEPSIADVNDAVSSLFVLCPDHPLGRLAPFRFDWRQVEHSGRKTVWNITTRGPKLATKIFHIGDRSGGDIRKGMRVDAASILSHELVNNARPSVQALICLVLNGSEFGESDNWVTARSVLLDHLGISSSDLLLIADERELGPPLLGPYDWSVDGLQNDLAPPSPVQYQTTYSTTPATAAAPHPEFSVVIDSRLEAILRRAITSFPCVLLVGPPGTGKGALLRWLVQSVAEDPASFGFSAELDPNPIWRTPDESWSSFELIGGLMPDESGILQWSHGLVPSALQDGRWLILDETNRADMDRIMGPLLTWLSNQEVEIGRTHVKERGTVVLGWSDTAECQRETISNGERTIRILAGRDWRLLGTYNPQDAHRVFRFGQALTRRFVIVPIPPISPGQFEQLLSTRYPFLASDALELIAELYRHHHDSTRTVLGPAVFLRMADYIGETDEDAGLEDIVLEAYVISVGRYLASYDDTEFDDLGQRILNGTQWTTSNWAWVLEQRKLLG